MMKEYKTDKRTLKIQIVISFLMIICIIILIKYKLYNLFKSVLSEEIVEITVIIAISISVVFMFVIYPLWYCSFQCKVSSEQIIIQSGVIFKKKIYVKTEAILYITRLKFLVSLNSNINILLINTCGGKVVIPFLSSNDMDKIVNCLQNNIKGRENK